MDKIRVMLADDNQTVLRLISEYLSHQSDTEVVAAVSDGARITDEVKRLHPDVLVMDIIMPRRDGFMALEELRRLPEEQRPQVIVLTGLARDNFILRAIELGASYYMVKPFDMQLLHSRILEVARGVAALPEAAPEPETENLGETVSNLFLTLGIPAHIKGYQYLREAVLMVVEQRDLISRITKELYPGIAKKYATSASKVERAMRHAIEVAWNRGRLDAVNQMYGYRVFSPDDKPANGEFIALIADKLSVKKSA